MKFVKVNNQYMESCISKLSELFYEKLHFIGESYTGLNYAVDTINLWLEKKIYHFGDNRITIKINIEFHIDKIRNNSFRINKMIIHYMKGIRTKDISSSYSDNYVVNEEMQIEHFSQIDSLFEKLYAIIMKLSKNVDNELLKIYTETVKLLETNKGISNIKNEI